MTTTPDLLVSTLNGMRNVGKIVSFIGLHADIQVIGSSFIGLTEQYNGCDPLYSLEDPNQSGSMNNFHQLFNADKDFVSYQLKALFSVKQHTGNL